MTRMPQKRDCEIRDEKNQDDRGSVLYSYANEIKKDASEDLSCHPSYNVSYFILTSLETR